MLSLAFIYSMLKKGYIVFFLRNGTGEVFLLRLKIIWLMKNRKIFNVVLIALVMSTVITTAASILKDNDNKVVVTIRGNIKSVSYNGKLQSSIGYTVESTSSLYTTEDFVCYATDSVSAVNAGTYAMGIRSIDFHNINPNFKDVEFVVIDGCLSITDDIALQPLASDK